MNALLDNEILVRQVAWTLLHTLWQGVGVALLLALTLRGMRRASVRCRVRRDALDGGGRDGHVCVAHAAAGRRNATR